MREFPLHEVKLSCFSSSFIFPVEVDRFHPSRVLKKTSLEIINNLQLEH